MVYFVSAKLMRAQGHGVTLIISPLLALMRNQIEAAQRLQLRALTINSTNPQGWDEVRRNLLADQADLLLISPERLANDDFVAHTLQPIAARIGLLVIDEAHCISDWGHDFRPDYRRIGQVLARLPRNIAVLATTATANHRVERDVAGQLGDGVQVQRGPLMRDSLALQVMRMPGPAERLGWLADRIAQMAGSGIVYTLTTRDADRVAQWLQSRGIDARAYHAGKDDAERQALEQALLANRLKCLVATTALGMGYDKPDLTFVIHFQAPGNVVAYYQQVGRAGRAIAEAYGVLMSGEEDADINAYFRDTAFPPQWQVDRILGALEAADGGLGVREIERAVNLRPSQIEKVLKLLLVVEARSSRSRWPRRPQDEGLCDDPGTPRRRHRSGAAVVRALRRRTAGALCTAVTARVRRAGPVAERPKPASLRPDGGGRGRSAGARARGRAGTTASGLPAGPRHRHGAGVGALDARRLVGDCAG
jgi:ATP-dependent DNA helicase RecQ